MDTKASGCSRSWIYEQRDENSEQSDGHQQGTTNEDTSISPTKRTFKSIVQRHFIKDRLFVLVNDLMRSVDEEKRAQEELIASFQTAREVTEPIRRQSIATAAGRRPKRRRKRSDASLLERIVQSRKESRDSLENIDIYNKNVARVGEMKIRANDTNNGDFSALSDYKENKRRHSEKTRTSKSSGDSYSVIDSGLEKSEYTLDNTEDSEPTFRRRAKSLPASESDKLSAIFELSRDENSLEVDKLVMDSILHENEDIEKEEEMKEKAKKENGKENQDGEIDATRVNGNMSDNDGNSTPDLTVKVESESESEKEDSDIKVVGSIDDNEGYIDEDTDDIDREDAIMKIKESNYNGSEYNRTPASVFPHLDPIAEASSESFPALHSSRSESSSVIEIQPKKGTLHSMVTSPICTNYESGINKEKHTNEKQRMEKQKSENMNIDNTSNANIRRNIWVVDSDKKKSRHSEKKNEKHFAQADNKNVNNVSYNETGEFNEVRVRSPKRNGNKESQNIQGSPLHRKNNKVVRGSQQNGKIRNSQYTNDSRHQSGEYEKKTRSKSARRISLDLLDVYEENSDLQRVSKSEFVPVNLENHRRTKSAHSPRRSRSKSPTKKKVRERKKHDLTPLPPKTLSAKSKNRDKPTLTLFRSKTDLSPFDSSVSSFEDIKDLSKNLQTFKNKLYRRPDSVLWERLDISEGGQRGRKDGVKWNDDLSYEVKYKYSGFTELNDRTDTEADSHKVTWNVPISEALKNITGTKNIPDISRIRHIVPREERVGRLYIDLKHERRVSGGVEYRRLKTPDRTEEIDDFTHL